jgi:hypothetical protein
VLPCVLFDDPASIGKFLPTWCNCAVPTKKFAEVQLSSGKTLLEEIVRLRELALAQGVHVIALGFDREHNYFVGGYVPVRAEEVIKMLFDFIAWLSSGNVTEENITRPSPDAEMN